MNTNNVKQALEDIQLDSATDQKILQKVQRYNRSHSKKKKALVLKRGFVPVVLCVAIVFVMIMEIPTYALMGFKGNLFLKKTNSSLDYHTEYYFLFDDSMKIASDEITGQVNECTEIMQERWENYDMLSSQYPGLVIKKIETYQEAQAYIGYEKLKMPQLDIEPDKVELNIEGNSLCEIVRLQLVETYKVSDSLYIDSYANIFLEDYLFDLKFGEGSVSNDFEGVDYSAKKRIQNGRVFYVVSSTEFENNWLTKAYYWEEDKVIYELYVRYQKEEEESIDGFAEKWMNGF